MKMLAKKDDKKVFCEPAVNIMEENGAYLLETELPGIDKKNIQVKIDDNTLTITAEQDEKFKNFTPVFKERPDRIFKRSFSLDETIDADKIEANYKNGLLTLKLKKRQELQPKKIEISVDKD
ncbi:Hsp20/alpha crystallin family protein [bacterium]|nr:Hsp20/alpha crystallin family protein [bacterium]